MKHDNVLRPTVKEPEFFTDDCNDAPPHGCPANATERYLRETLPMAEFLASKGKSMPVEASTHIVRSNESVIRGLRESVPWVKLVISMREPISRAASMLIHMHERRKKGCFHYRGDLGYCLSKRSQVMHPEAGPDGYAAPMRAWLQEWPADQIHVVQFEELVDSDTEEDVLTPFVEFVGIKPRENNRLTVVNARLGTKQTIFEVDRSAGFKMKRRAYAKLVKKVRADMEELLAVLEEHGKVRDAQAWRERWEAVWQDNLASCDSNNECTILLS